jgi:uncharacterized LabA/DUF88 family protein
MLQVAVFIDAGYLFAQGSTALAGHKQPRNSTFLKVDSALEVIKAFAEECVHDARLLRIYWYDGVIQGRLSSVQEQLAGSSFCKLRLGVVNSAGQQKGVDSLIVTDMIELARNHAISDAILIAGDEDLRIGVQIAQGFGVRVHLVGIKPARGSQSGELIKESDTHHEWGKEKIAGFLDIEAAVETSPDEDLASTNSGQAANVAFEADIENVFKIAVDGSFGSLTEVTRQQVLDAYKANPSSVPVELDRKMLPTAGAALDRRLSEPEKRSLRAICKVKLQDLSDRKE